MTGNMRTLLVLTAAFVSVIAQDFPIIDELDIPKYLGQWKQTHASNVVYATIEPNSTCTTANYALYDLETLTVFNADNLYQPGGPRNNITGYAYVTEEVGKLLVDFPSLDNQTADYWIMKLGPPVYGDGEQYAYSLISEPNKLFLFVLARDVDDFYENYEEEVMDFLFDNGFNNTLNEPIPTEHSDACDYPPTPASLKFRMLEVDFVL